MYHCVRGVGDPLQYPQKTKKANFIQRFKCDGIDCSDLGGFARSHEIYTSFPVLENSCQSELSNSGGDSKTCRGSF